MNLFDTNVLLDIATADPIWLPWSEKEFRTSAARGPIFINPIIYTELAPAFATAAALDQWLDPAVFQKLPLPYAAGWLAAQAFLKYRRSGGTKTSPLPISRSEHTRKSKDTRSSHATRPVIAPISRTSR